MRQSVIRLTALALVLAFAPGVRAAEDEPAPEKPVEAEPPKPKPEVEPVRGIRYRVWLKSGRSLEFLFPYRRPPTSTTFFESRSM